MLKQSRIHPLYNLQDIGLIGGNPLQMIRQQSNVPDSPYTYQDTESQRHLKIKSVSPSTTQKELRVHQIQHSQEQRSIIQLVNVKKRKSYHKKIIPGSSPVDSKEQHRTDHISRTIENSINEQTYNYIPPPQQKENYRSSQYSDWVDKACKQQYVICKIDQPISSIKEQFDEYYLSLSELQQSCRPQNNKIPQHFMLEIKEQPNIDNCLGCAKFFNINENLYFPENQKGLLALGQGCNQMIANKNKLLQEVCGLLNGGGGCLLFNAQRYNNRVFAIGYKVTERQKDAMGLRFLSFIDQNIYPKPISPDVSISWVPIVDPSQPSNNSLSFVPGTYIARVLIQPKKRHITYFWLQEGSPVFSVRKKSIEPSGMRTIKGKDIRKFIMQKFKRFETECCEQNRLLDKQRLPSIRKCCSPHFGRQIWSSKAKIEKNECQQHKQFTYASIVVAKKADHETIRANLKKYNIDCVIRTPFEKLKLRGAASSSVLYHNTRFDELLGVVSYNNDFKFGGRYLLVILITPYIRLMDRNRDNQMNENDLKSLGVWLNREYPQETLSLWEFRNDTNELEYYISTGTRESSLYIYIVMTQFQEKAVFKNPKDLETLSKEKLYKRFRQIRKV